SRRATGPIIGSVRATDPGDARRLHQATGRALCPWYDAIRPARPHPAGRRSTERKGLLGMPRARAGGPARMVAGALVALLLVAAARPGPSSADVGSSTVGSAQLNGIALLPGGGAWAVGQGGTIAYSADGSSWTVNTTAGVVGNLNAVVAVDDQLALAVTDHGTVVRTVDGATWSAQTDVSAVAVKLNGVAVGASRVWAVGQVDPVQTTPMFISSDGGATWSAYLAVSPDADLYGIAAVRDADDTLYAVGDNGHI